MIVSREMKTTLAKRKFSVSRESDYIITFYGK
jgi:hypothetical protein